MRCSYRSEQIEVSLAFIYRHQAVSGCIEHQWNEGWESILRLGKEPDEAFIGCRDGDKGVFSSVCGGGSYRETTNCGEIMEQWVNWGNILKSILGRRGLLRLGTPLKWNGWNIAKVLAEKGLNNLVISWSAVIGYCSGLVPLSIKCASKTAPLKRTAAAGLFDFNALNENSSIHPRVLLWELTILAQIESERVSVGENHQAGHKL